MFFLRKAIIIIVVIDALLFLSRAMIEIGSSGQKKDYFKLFPFGGIRKWGAAFFLLTGCIPRGRFSFFFPPFSPPMPPYFFLSKMEDNVK